MYRQNRLTGTGCRHWRRHLHIVTAAEFVQQISFDIDIGFGIDIPAQLEAYPPQHAFNMALLYLDPVTGKITAAIQIAQRQLRLRLDIPAALQSVFPPIFGAESKSLVIVIAADFFPSVSRTLKSLSISEYLSTKSK